MEVPLHIISMITPPPSSHTAVRLFKISFLYWVKVTSLRQQLSALGGKRPILYLRGGRRAPKTKRREERLWLDSHGTTWPTSSKSKPGSVLSHSICIFLGVLTGNQGCISDCNVQTSVIELNRSPSLQIFPFYSDFVLDAFLPFLTSAVSSG